MRPALQYVTGNPVRSAGGFTLIEVLMVVAIIGIFVSVTVLNLGDGGLSRKVEDETLRMNALIHLAQEESILNAKEIRLELTQDGYQFKEFFENKWQDMEDDVFRPRKLSAGIELALSVESMNIVFKTREEDEDNESVDDTESKKVSILFLSSGEMTPFVMTFKSEYLPLPYELIGQANGETELKLPDS